MNSAGTAIAAFIVVPAATSTTHAAQCFAYLEARGWVFEGLFTDFQEAWTLACSGAASVVVVARPDHIDPQHAPRVEVANLHTGRVAPPRNDGPLSRRQRRANQV